jgi:diguanylate cyclase (GGDEF)-like protein/PAS domain S-box-containing protein
VKRAARAAQTRPPRSPASVPDSDRRIARRGRLAALGIVVILLGVSGFAVWSSRVTAAAARDAVTASRLSDTYDRAASAVVSEESLERKYRLEPGPSVRASYDAATANFVSALRDGAAHGGADDQVFVAKVLAQQADYLAAINRMFTQVDLGNTAAVLKIDGGEVDPTFGVIEGEVTTERSAQDALATSKLSDLKHLERLTSQLTPAVFGLGLLVAGLLAGLGRGYRRLLWAERADAFENSLRDPLTGLPNRALLADRFEAVLDTATRSGATTALLLIDVDRFREINDTFGHKYGDQVLTLIGRRFAAVVGAGDVVARIGGDEFAIVLPDVGDLASAMEIAANLQDALETSFHVEGVELEVDASIGIVLSGEHGTDAATLLQHADIAMYAAKNRNVGILAYSREIDEYSPERLALHGDLRRALELHEIVLYYQPKVSVESGEVVGVEALARWQHPTQGLLYPDSFIPLAEHTGLIGPFTSYMLDAACAQARIWADKGSPMPVAVNLSGRNLLDEHLATEVADLLAAHGVSASLLELEVTESAIMLDPVRARQLLQSLSDLGIRLSIDDFGAGYTSLSQLKSLPIDELKIDRSFVMTMSSDARDALIVQSVIELGQNLGLNIVAEGVETAQALATLRGFDCDIAQGYYIARPAPVEVFDAWLATRRSSAPLPIVAAPPRQPSDAVFTERDLSEAPSAAAALRASEERFRALFTLAPIGITEARADGAIVAMNPHACTMLGYELDEVLGRSVTMFVDPDHAAAQARSLAALPDTGAYSVRRIFRRKDGTPITIVMSVGVVRNASGDVHRMVGMMVDVSELAAAEQSLAANVLELAARESELQKSAAFHDAVLAASPDVIFVSDPVTSSVLWCSRSLSELGYTDRQLKAFGGSTIDTIVHPDDQCKVWEQNAAAQELRDGEVVRMRYRIRVQDDGYRWFGRSVTPFARDDAGNVTQIFGITSDVTELVEAEQRLADAALHDPLTGLANHTLLIDRLTKTLARSNRSGHQLAVVFCNVGGFCKVNEDGGREAGDAVLKATAGRLLSTLRPEDTAARIGVDGFAIILEPSSHTWAGPDSAPIDVHAYALEVAQRIETVLAAPIDFDGREYAVTVSLGLAIAQAGDDVEEILAQAEAAMRRSKILGENRHVVASGVRRASAR